MQEFNEITSEFKMIGSFDSNETESLQRTEQWFADRAGRFTGSRVKDLMSCGSSTAKMPWGHIEKLVDFGAPAEKYIFQVGMERNTGFRDMETFAKQMEWGTQNETNLINQLIDDGLISDFVEMGFEKFKNYENGGASVDGVCMYKGERIGIETKCCVSWDGFFARMYDVVDEKHKDFWQCQAESMAVGVKKVLFVAAMPMTTKNYEFQIVESSPIHQQCILQRCEIADKAIELWDGKNYREALEIACANFKTNQ